MSMDFSLKLNRILARYEELRDVLASSTMENPAEFAKLSKEFADLTPIAEAIQLLQRYRNEAADMAILLATSDLEPDMRLLVEDEARALNANLTDQEHHIKVMLLPKDEADDRNAILEVRAGTGGDEAGLFAADLFRMYQRYADLKGWRFEILSISDTGIGGIKEASASITGRGVFARLKFESGVHRVQRVPATEASGRIHTSAATVAMLPEAEDIDVVIEEKDLKIDVFRSSGPGGQSVNTTDSAVRITHIPTGTVVQQQDEKSQHKNKAKALKILRARIFEQQRLKLEEERSASRKGQVGSGDRSERIRTYNFPQGRVTDHRINLTLYKIDRILDGSALDEMIEALVADDQAQRLAADN